MSRVLILVGSVKDGVNAALARSAARVLPASVEVVDFPRLAELPHYGEYLDEPGVNAVVDEFRAVVASVDGILLVTPEYNAGPSSMIKNALDTASRPPGASAIGGKPVAVIGATISPGGAAGARSTLLEGLPRARALTVEPSVGISSAHTRLEGRDYGQDVEAELEPVIDALVAAIAGQGN